MTETNQARDLLATLRDELHKLAWTLERWTPWGSLKTLRSR